MGQLQPAGPAQPPAGACVSTVSLEQGYAFSYMLSLAAPRLLQQSE